MMKPFVERGEGVVSRDLMSIQWEDGEIWKRTNILNEFTKVLTWLQPHISDDCETSYLSHQRHGRFWRAITSAFPQVIDFLATTDPSASEFRHLLKDGLTALLELDKSYEMALHRGDSVEEEFYAEEFTPMHEVIGKTYHPAIADWLHKADDSQLQSFYRCVSRLIHSSIGGIVKE